MLLNINKKNINTAVVSPISQDTWYGEAFGIVYGFMAVNVPIIEAVKHILSPQVLVLYCGSYCYFIFCLSGFPDV
jgi:hypothetical protein